MQDMEDFLSNEFVLEDNVNIDYLKYHCMHLSHVMRKPVLAICEQQGRRSACASAQSDQHLWCSLPG